MPYDDSVMGAFQASAVGSFPLTAPAGATAGKIVIMRAYTESNVTVSAWPSGFVASPIPPATFVTGRGYPKYAWKQLTGSEAGNSWAPTLSGSSLGSASAVILNGRDTGASPFSSTPQTVTDAGPTGNAPTAITATALLGDDAVYFLDDWNGSTSLTTAGFVARINTAEGAHLFTADNLSAGSISAQSATNGSSNTWWGLLALIKAAPIAGGIPDIIMTPIRRR